MAISDAQKIAKAKYQQEKRTLIAADVSRGKGDFYRTSAATLKLSLSMLIQNGVEEYIQNHAGQVAGLSSANMPISKPKLELTAEQKRLVENFAQLPKATRAKFAGLIEEFATQMQKGGDSNGDDRGEG